MIWRPSKPAWGSVYRAKLTSRPCFHGDCTVSTMVRYHRICNKLTFAVEHMNIILGSNMCANKHDNTGLFV